MAVFYIISGVFLLYAAVLHLVSHMLWLWGYPSLTVFLRSNLAVMSQGLVCLI
jgi:hypothetical protein